MRYVIICALGLTTLSGNVAAQQEVTQPPTRLPATRVVADTTNLVTVQNDRSVAVTVYVERGALERRLGVVSAGSVATLPLPAWAADGRSKVRLLARPEGNGFALATPGFTVSGVGRIGLLVPSLTGAASVDSIPVLLTAEQRAGTTVTVSNPRGRAITVFAEQGMRLVKLGEVAAKGEGTLVVPKELVGRGGDIRLFVRSAGGTEVATRPLALKSGDHLSLDIVF